LKRKKLYVVLAAVGALALLLAGLSGIAVVSAQEPTPESEDVSGCGIWGWGRGLFGFGRGGQWTMFDTAAETLGLTPEELFSELHAGKTMEEVAEEQGVEMETVQEALSAAREEAMRDAIAQAVEDSTMSQEQADWLLEGLDKGFMPRGRGFGHGRGMRGGFGGFAPAGIRP
jgi:ABC-type sugar transport system substrate-binding protein